MKNLIVNNLIPLISLYTFKKNHNISFKMQNILKCSTLCLFFTTNSSQRFRFGSIRHILRLSV